MQPERTTPERCEQYRQQHPAMMRRQWAVGSGHCHWGVGAVGSGLTTSTGYVAEDEQVYVKRNAKTNFRLTFTVIKNSIIFNRNALLPYWWE